MDNAGLTSATHWASVLETIADVAFAIVIVALAVELISGRAARHFRDKLEAARELQIANANAEAAKAQRETTSLQIQLEQERQKRAPRAFSAEQKVALVAQLRGKIGRINVVVQRDAEARAYALQLEIALQEAGATMQPHEMPAGTIVLVPGGVLMYRPGGRPSSEEDLRGDPLYEGLKASGVFGGFAAEPWLSPTVIQDGPPETWPRLPPDQYAVYIGQKLPW